jgi:hypothetical protein
MPNAKVLSEKQAIVEALTERLKKSSSGVIVDYKGITVDEDTALRTEMRKNGVEYTVVKNTLLKFAVNNLGLWRVLIRSQRHHFPGHDGRRPHRPVPHPFSDYSKKLNDKFNIKAAFMEGQVLEHMRSRSWRACLPRKLSSPWFSAPCWPPSPAWPSSTSRRPDRSRRSRARRSRRSSPQKPPQPNNRPQLKI